MATIRAVKKKYGGGICRRCLNREYGAELLPQDCVYSTPYPELCPCCDSMGNIVSDLRLSGKLKLAGK